MPGVTGIPNSFPGRCPTPPCVCESITTHVPGRASSIWLCCDVIKTLPALTCQFLVDPEKQASEKQLSFLLHQPEVGLLGQAGDSDAPLDTSYQLLEARPMAQQPGLCQLVIHAPGKGPM